MKGRNLVQTLYETQLARSFGPVISSDEPLAVYRLYVKDTPKELSGWLILEYENKVNREILFFHNRNGVELLVYKKDRWISPTAAQNITHSEGSSVRMHDVADFFNTLSKNVSDLGYIEQRYNGVSALSIKVFGGDLIVGGGSRVSVGDTILNLSPSLTHNIYIDISDGIVKSKTTAINESSEIWLGVVVTGTTNITSITDKRYDKININFSSSFFKFDGNIISIKDGSIGATQIADESITSNKIASGAVGSDEIASGAVGSDEITSNAVTSSKIANGQVTSLKLESNIDLGETFIQTVSGSNPSAPATGKIRLFSKNLLGQPTPHAITPDGTVIPLGINPIVAPGSVVAVGPISRTANTSSTTTGDMNVLLSSSRVTNFIIKTGSPLSTIIEADISANGNITFNSYGIDGSLLVETSTFTFFYHIVY